MELNMYGLDVRERTTFGKGTARKLRRAGRVPAVSYSEGKDPFSFDLDPKELLRILRNRGRNSVFELKAEGENNRTVMLKTLQRHPLKRNIIHADFLEIDVNKPVEVEVRLNYVGRPIGLQYGGIADVVRRKIPISSLPTHIPLQIDVPVAHLQVGDVLHVSDVEPPEGVSIPEDAMKFTLVVIAAPKADEKDVSDEEGVEGEEAAAAAEAPAA